MEKKSGCAEITNYNEIKCSDTPHKNSHEFKNGEYYKNGKYFGDVVFSDDKIIQVECKNGNMYMQGQIITIIRLSPPEK